MTPAEVVKKVVFTAVRYAAVRGQYRKMLDSKSTDPKDLEKQKKKLLDVSNELEVVARQFESLYRKYSAEKTKKRKVFPWQSIYQAVKTGVDLIEGVRGAQPAAVGRVIEMEGEVVKGDPR